jgi:hypothetical protein
VNGPQHYAMAQQLDAEAAKLAAAAADDQRPEPIEWLLGRAQVAAARAQVHATLAAVAVAVDAHGSPADLQGAWDWAMR